VLKTLVVEWAIRPAEMAQSDCSGSHRPGRTPIQKQTSKEAAPTPSDNMHPVSALEGTSAVFAGIGITRFTSARLLGCRVARAEIAALLGRFDDTLIRFVPHDTEALQLLIHLSPTLWTYAWREQAVGPEGVSHAPLSHCACCWCDVREISFNEGISEVRGQASRSTPPVATRADVQSKSRFSQARRKRSSATHS
jgi:hypothetical protein